MGNADGSIIATIITMISAKNRARSVAPTAEGAVSNIVGFDDVHVTYQAIATTKPTAAATGIVRRRSRSGTAGETASATARPIGRADKNSPFRSDLDSTADENTLNKPPRMRGLGEGRRTGDAMGLWDGIYLRL